MAVMNSSMHPSDQASTVSDLFDGEISVAEIDDEKECEKLIRVKKLRNQDYKKGSVCLTNGE